MLTEEQLEKLRYPVGRFINPVNISTEAVAEFINTIEIFPEKLSKAVSTLTESQLDTQYRPQGWTIRQVVHHCADSHMNSLIRFKWALTEETPTIKAYDEAKWAALPDAKMPIIASLKMLGGIHARWTVLLKSFDQGQLKSGFIHPEHGRLITLEEAIAMYAWHCDHHLGHIASVFNRE